MKAFLEKNVIWIAAGAAALVAYLGYERFFVPKNKRG